MSCRPDRLRHISIQSSRSHYVFLLARLMYITYLTRFTITRLVIFTQHFKLKVVVFLKIFTQRCILPCYGVFVLIFRKKVSIFVRFLSAFLLIFWQLVLFLISPFCTQFHFSIKEFLYMICMNTTYRNHAC